MKIKLHKMPEDTKGIYKVKGVEGRMPERMLYLAPDAAVSFIGNKLTDHTVVSDMYRSAESSLAAVKSGRGAQRPGFSAHNWGLAIDIDVNKTIKLMECRTKKNLDELMETYGFFCHRRDHQITDLKGESHHYTFLGIGAVISPAVKTIVNYTEAAIVSRYGNDFKLDNKGVQSCLAKLKLYSGEIDGLLGPISKAAITAFQRAWALPSTASAYVNSATKRTLAFVSADMEIL